MNSPISTITSPISIITSEISIIECQNAPKKICPRISFPTPQAGPVSAPKRLFATEFPGQTESPEVFKSEAPPSKSQINAAMAILNKIPILSSPVIDADLKPVSIETKSTKLCPRVKYKGQKRQCKCDRPCYKYHPMCQRHYKLKYGLIMKNGVAPSY